MEVVSVKLMYLCLVLHGLSKHFLILAKRAAVRPRAKRVYNFVARIARVSSTECDFALVTNLSFCRFGIRSCLAPNHKQTPTDAIQHDVIVHFRFPGNAIGLPPTRANFIHPLFTVTLLTCY